MTVVMLDPHPAPAPSSPSEQQSQQQPDQRTDSEKLEARRLALRKLRTEVQDLQNFLEIVRAGEATVKAYKSYVEKARQDIRELVDEVDKLTSEDKDGDSIRNIRNLWELMQTNPLLANPDGELKSDEQLHCLSLLQAQARKIVFTAGFWTIPERLNDWLASASPGYYVPFHVVFEDELPNADDRLRMLNYLAWAPTRVNAGFVDPATGLIYRYAEDAQQRALSVIYLAIAFLVLTTLVLGIGHVGIAEWPFTPDQDKKAVTAWLAVVAGALVHIVVGASKRLRAQPGLPPILALGNFSRIINAKLGSFMLKLITALIGFCGLAFAGGEMTLLNAFLVGYSLDSFIELFGSGLEQRATAQLNAVQSRLQPS